MGVDVVEPRQTFIQSNAEPEAKPVVALDLRDGEASGQKGRLEGKAVSFRFTGMPSED
jgi:hypothetical protein